MNHTVESVYKLNIDNINSLSNISKIICFCGFTFGRIGVPLFLFLTGYLLLSRTYDNNKIKKFYKHNFAPLLFVWEIWIFIYCVFIACYNSTPFDFAAYFRRAFFLEHAGLSHTWYMPMIIGMYIFLPYVATAIERINNKTLGIMMFILYIYLFVVPCINLWQKALQVADNQCFKSQIDLSYGGNAYGLYLAVGVLIFRYKNQLDIFFKEKRLAANLLFVSIAITAFASTVYMQIKLYSMNAPYNVWYNSPGLPVIGACVFVLMSQVKWIHFLQVVLKKLSLCSFGIYLTHKMVLMMLIRAIGDVHNKPSQIIIISVITFLLSYIIVELLSVIPYVKYLFLKKE